MHDLISPDPQLPVAGYETVGAQDAVTRPCEVTTMSINHIQFQPGLTLSEFYRLYVSPCKNIGCEA